jgi:hypothetical protein
VLGDFYHKGDVDGAGEEGDAGGERGWLVSEGLGEEKGGGLLGRGKEKGGMYRRHDRYTLSFASLIGKMGWIRWLELWRR